LKFDIGFVAFVNLVYCRLNKQIKNEKGENRELGGVLLGMDWYMCRRKKQKMKKIYTVEKEQHLTLRNENKSYEMWLLA
jgi:hypothetical protein